MKNYILILFLVLGACRIQAQYHEAGIFMGISNYWGDLTPPKQFFLETHFAVGLAYQFNITPRFSVRSNIIWGQISGDDRHSDEGSGRKQRNLDFLSDIWEFSALFNANILPFHPERGSRPITPYGFLGISLFHFNPTTMYKSERIALQPLGTEGQGITGYPDKYARWQVSIPFGLGIKFSLSSHFNLMIEGGMRKTFTDYLDDVSGDYVALDVIKNGNGDLAATLSNRTYDADGKQIEQVGVPRGHAGKDWYTFVGVIGTYSFQGNYFFKRKKKKSSKPKKPKKKGSSRWM
ncbi:MAG: hypothetical protein GY810_21890 [Aureispira sp.]|nr:hypothetical protein [Aureispira sp.]